MASSHARVHRVSFQYVTQNHFQFGFSKVTGSYYNILLNIWVQSTINIISVNETEKFQEKA